MGKRTAFYDSHLKANAKIVDFAGWDMPLHYGSQIQEHHQIRQHVGMFDVSHMGIVDLQGENVQAFLRYLFANNVDKLQNGGALYTCMLNEQGGIIDDLIVYKIANDYYRLVINAGTREKDIAWIQQQAQSFHIDIRVRHDLVILAIQGPEAKDKLKHFFSEADASVVLNLKPFTFAMLNQYFIARTGYTGEDGFEILFPAVEAATCWQKCLDLGIVPCGLGARDTLRLEAGLNLYGSDMDDKVTPMESNLAWTVALEPQSRNFIGRTALENQLKQGVRQQLIGLVLEGPGIIRHHQKVFNGKGEGVVTSGGYSPTLEKSIALARVSVEMGTSCFVEIRQKPIPAQAVKPPFVRRGKKMF